MFVRSDTGMENKAHPIRLNVHLGEDGTVQRVTHG